MPRESRKSYEGQQTFHVMTQGIKKENIFMERREKLEYIRLINKFKQEYKIKTISYCIMDNHAHLLLKADEISSMTKFMHKINTSYGIYYNKNRDRVGYVFRNRFKAQPITTINYLYNCILYIHNNPVKAGICNHAKHYKFSSYYNFISQNKKVFAELFENEYEYEYAHEKKNAKMFFIEDEADREKEIIVDINNYLKEKQIHKLELKADKDLLIPIASKLKIVYNLSNREISAYLDVGRETIRNVLK